MRGNKKKLVIAAAIRSVEYSVMLYYTFVKQSSARVNIVDIT